MSDNNPFYLLSVLGTAEADHMPTDLTGTCFTLFIRCLVENVLDDVVTILV